MSNQTKLVDAKNAFGQKKEELRTILNKEGKHSKEDRDAMATLETEIEEAKSEVERYEKAVQMDADAARSAANAAGGTTGGSEAREKAKLFNIGDVMQQLRGGTMHGAVAEMNQEALRRGGMGVGGDGVNIPLDMFTVRRTTQKRDIQATGAATGTPYVPIQTMSFIDALRNDIVMMNMGATMLTSLTGSMKFPRKTSGVAVAAATENAGATETTPAVDGVDLAPKRITAFTDVSTQVSIQANEDILAITENDLYQATLQELQRQLIHGSGSSGEMLGLLGISGIGSIATATVTYAVIQNIIDEVAKDNAMIGPSGWLTNSFIRKLLKQKEEIASSGYKIWANDNTIDGFPVWMTNSVSRVLGTGNDASALIFGGDWSQFIIAQWGSVNLQRNPYTKQKDALTEVIIHSWWDCDAKHPEAFAADVAITA